MAINLNAEPYNDDFSSDKNFYQILFKPSLAVQARELTQLQTILRDQIAKFGNHIFEHGSVVIPGNSLGDLAVPYIKLQSQFNSADINISNFENKIIVGVTTGIRAVVKKTVAATNTDPIVFYLSYISGGTTTVNSVTVSHVNFLDGEEIYVEDSTGIRATLQISSATGVGSLAYVNSGVYYIHGTFVSVAAQSVVISKYTSTPSCHVLLKITEETIDYTEDETLLDNAQNSYNYAAPGADRLKISLTLTTLPLGSSITEDCVEIMRYNEGVLEQHSKNPKYSELEKSLARRTFDESGNYVVSGLVPNIREHLKSNNNGGVYPEGDISKLVVEVDPGKAYINGFEVEKIAKSRIDINKARTAAHIKDTSILLRPEYGQYIIISDVVGSFSVYSHQTVDLYNDNDNTNASATKIGTANVIGIDYLAGDPSSGAGAIYKLWVNEVLLDGQYTIESVGGIRYDTTKYAYVLTSYNAPITSGGFTVGETITHSSGRTATVKYWDATSATLYTYKHNHTLATPRVGDLIVGSSSSTTSTIAGKTLLYSVGQSGLVFRLPKTTPYSLKNASTNNYDLQYTVQKELTIVTDSSGNGSVSVSSGETINPIELGTFVAIGPSGVVTNNKFSLNTIGTTITVSSGPTSSTIRVYAAVTKDNVSPKTKTVTTYTQIVSSPSSTIILDKTDIIGIASIVDGIGDITANYTLWNGQTDYSYNRGTVTLKTGKPAAVGSVTITYTYYEHSIAGDFFCIDSYPAGILDTTTVYNSLSTGQLYELPACLDFRPSVGVDGFFTGTNSRRNSLIISGTTFNSSMQYYVPRIDALTVNSTGVISVIAGTPSEAPESPAIPQGQFALNVFYIPEYTKSSADVLSKRLDVERFTMGDIKNISNRVDRVEDFATLTASELSVTTLNVKDAATGLDKFKTGYLVENFTNPLSIARTTSGDWAAIFVGQTLQPKMENLLCELTLQPSSSSNYVNKNGFLMLPYTESVFAQQSLSSRVTNVNPFLMISWNGILDINPPSDDWVEVQESPTIFEQKTEEIIVNQPFPCPADPPRPPLPPPVYGGWYGEVLGRAGETGGVDFWKEAKTSNSAAEVAAAFLNSAAFNANRGAEPTFNKISASQLASNKVLTSTTTYSYDSRGKLVATTTGVNLDGTTFTKVNNGFVGSSSISRRR